MDDDDDDDEEDGDDDDDDGDDDNITCLWGNPQKVPGEPAAQLTLTDISSRL